jgi:hypothetical protein
MDARALFGYLINALSTGAITTAMLALLGKYWFEHSIEKHKAELSRETERLKAALGKDAETHRWILKKNELLFEKEFNAASEFFELRRTFLPRHRPDMDWHEAMEDVITSFTGYEKRLGEFMAKHGPVLSSENRTALNACLELASTHQFALRGSIDEQKNGEAAAEEFLSALEQIEGRFVKELRA